MTSISYIDRQWRRELNLGDSGLWTKTSIWTKARSKGTYFFEGESIVDWGEERVDTRSKDIRSFFKGSTFQVHDRPHASLLR